MMPNDTLDEIEARWKHQSYSSYDKSRDVVLADIRTLIEMVRARDRVVVEARAVLEHYDEAPARHSVHVLSRYMRAVRESLAVLDTPSAQEQKR